MHNFYSRYARQLILPEFGINGQKIIKNSKIICVGLGGLGSPAVLYLANAGIGTLGIVDFDIVNITNLNRQLLFYKKDIGKKKVKCAKKHIYKIDKNIKINIYSVKLNHINGLQILNKYDIILDCTDNFKSKLLINDYAVKLGIPLVHGSLFGFEGYVGIFAKKKFCYRCIYKNINDLTKISCHGILGPASGIIGVFQALESIKFLIYKKNKQLKYKFSFGFLVFDFKSLTIKILKIRNKINCFICS